MTPRSEKLDPFQTFDNVRTIPIESEKPESQATGVKLRHMDFVKNETVNELCHELRAPLVSVRSFLEFLRDGCLPPEEVKTLAGLLHCEMERLDKLVSDMLSLARMESGQASYTYTKSDLNEIAAQCVSVMGIAAKRRNITLRFEKDSNLPLVQLAPNRIKQAIINMLDNALKFSTGGGEIVVSTHNRPNEVCLSVRDFGRGIEPDNIEKVFSKFERIRMDDDYIGAGLGMPLAKSIIEMGHHGKIWVESEGLNKGAIFSFSLPKK